LLDHRLVPATFAPAERGSPLVWRAGSAGRPPGGPGFAELETTVRGVADRPWSPAHLRIESGGDGGLKLGWLARARLDGDRWDAEPASPDGPARYRVQVGEDDVVHRAWEVDGAEADYPAAWRAEDFPAGLTAAAWVEVAQW